MQRSSRAGPSSCCDMPSDFCHHASVTSAAASTLRKAPGRQYLGMQLPLRRVQVTKLHRAASARHLRWMCTCLEVLAQPAILQMADCNVAAGACSLKSRCGCLRCASCIHAHASIRGAACQSCFALLRAKQGDSMAAPVRSWHDHGSGSVR